MSKEAVERLLDEVYNTMMEVERNPTGAFMAIQSLSARLAEVEASDAEGTRLMLGAQKRTRQYKARAEAAEAERDALQAKLAVAVEAMAGFASWDHCWPGNVNLEAECRKISAVLAQLTADTPKEGKDDDV